MIASMRASWNRVYGLLGRVSMYRAVLLSLSILAAIALVLSIAGQIGPAPLDLLATAAVLVATTVAVDALARRVVRIPFRAESSLITALILLFVLFPTSTPLGLVGIAIAAAAAAVSKYLLVWRGRHIFNPAAVGATVVTVVAVLLPLGTGIGASAWWVGTPVMFGPVLLFGILVLWRTERLGMAALFFVVAGAVNVVRAIVQYQQYGMDFDVWTIVVAAVTATPFLFLAGFMLSEPLTLPPRRWQRLVVALVVGVLAGWPISLGAMTLGQERALLIGNLVAFAFAVRGAIRLRLTGSTALDATARQLTFEAGRRFRFRAGQYLELDVPHRRPDARGTRREFSIVSPPSELPTVRIAYRDRGEASSSFKRALDALPLGATVRATGVWGDFVLPADRGTPVLLIAAGIGVTPFVSQVLESARREEGRDIVLVLMAYTAEALLFRDEFASTSVSVIVVTPDEPERLPAGWRWAGGGRLDSTLLGALVPDLRTRVTYVSGPPAVLADLEPALRGARRVVTDAFSGY